MLTETVTGIAPDNQPFHLFILTNGNGMSIQVMDWGATWVSCKVPVNHQLKEVLLGCKIQDYPLQQVYLGATVGRYANRIANASFQLNDKEYQLVANQGEHHIHGGNGFSHRRWNIKQKTDNRVTFSLFSEDGDQGFGGNVTVFVTYHLTENNEVKIEFEGESDQDTPLNLTNHSYFNLDNAEIGSDVRDHKLQLNADYFLPVDNEGIPNAPLKALENTSFDFRNEKSIGKDFLKEEQQLTKGYDHSFLLNHQDEQPCAILTASDNSLQLQVFTSQPALQVYTGNYLAGTPNRGNEKYNDYSGIALENQALPDTPNHPEWQKYGGIIKAGEKYKQWTIFKID
ncbi:MULTISPECIES: galactose-1-epimerase [Pasteurellaceae]|uniref:Aldose 1-epimerase n=1 Tax=Pasteurella atlantica TaxID=2827233 RepID=A0AAW8CIY1_9PAST|nr:galactose-1-epimerase [Pasteurella atlantica]MBR0573997.1 galactose-1-epimerase [Pasteurella atlantica]MDP8039960.1 galactose-1-epimerase [Pasteurella atlantica]MDP8042036.1 galactose-1-epimerase [Pasteurella atlantica]MDP8044221.1 galactose-1-epimerase [Pasteurella atlantica]MDP8046214.1 galactose-1-epimerase [Pasteurella atlantica]